MTTTMSTITQRLTLSVVRKSPSVLATPESARKRENTSAQMIMAKIMAEVFTVSRKVSISCRPLTPRWRIDREQKRHHGAHAAGFGRRENAEIEPENDADDDQNERAGEPQRIELFRQRIAGG